MKRVINEIKQAEGMVRESLSSRTEEKKSNIFLVEIILIILFIVVFFTSNSYPIPMIKIFWKWVMVGIGALIIDGFMIKLWERTLKRISMDFWNHDYCQLSALDGNEYSAMDGVET